MEPNNLIDELARKLVAGLPKGLGNIGDDVQNNFKAVLQSGLGKLDLVTRREFDVQRQVLERTREKLDALTKRLDELDNAE